MEDNQKEGTMGNTEPEQVDLPIELLDDDSAPAEEDWNAVPLVDFGGSGGGHGETPDQTEVADG